MKQRTLFLKTSVFQPCNVFASTAMASEFRLPEVFIAGTALSSAVAANPDLPRALPYNPATVAFQKEGQWRSTA